MSTGRWNASLHAFDRLLDAVPEHAVRGLDVGCGEGETARRLRARVPAVVGLDPDTDSIAAAAARDDDIDYVVGSLDSAGLAPASFDVVTAVGMLHHVDHRLGLRQLAALVRPRGLLLVVGFARPRSPGDFVRDAVDAVAIRRFTLTRGVWETPAPKIWPPPLSYGQACAASLEVLPDADVRRVPYFRYGLVWRRPPEP